VMTAEMSMTVTEINQMPTRTRLKQRSSVPEKHLRQVQSSDMKYLGK
jgi:hypothetical protein